MIQTFTVGSSAIAISEERTTFKVSRRYRPTSIRLWTRSRISRERPDPSARSAAVACKTHRADFRTSIQAIFFRCTGGDCAGHGILTYLLTYCTNASRTQSEVANGEPGEGLLTRST